MRNHTQTTERIAFLLAATLLVSVLTLSSAQPDGVSGNAYGCQSGSSDTLGDHVAVTTGSQTSGSLTRANPETPPFCDQTRHNMYLDVPNTREEDTAIYLTRQRLPDNQTTDPCARPSGQRVFIPKR